MTAHPGSAEENDCVEKIARDYVERVETRIWDDFETYVATFVDRNKDGDAGLCAGERAGVSCTELDVEWGEKTAPIAEDGACPDELVAAVDQAVRDRRSCWSGGAFRERIERFEDVPIRLRALMVGELVVEGGVPTVVLNYNRPWVEEMTSCVVDELGDDSVTVDFAGVSSCHSRLVNRGVTLWFGPSFNYVYEE